MAKSKILSQQGGKGGGLIESQFYDEIVQQLTDHSLREAIAEKKSQNCGLFPYGGGGLNPIP